MALLILVAIVAIAATWGSWRHIAYDGRTLPDGHTYTFLIGDNLRHYGCGATFYGMGVILPKQFPNIYLDSRKGGGKQSRYIIDASQRISLEGNFDKYFQLYAPKGSQSLALSIITPDIMQTLMDVAGNYDIELYRDRLHIISNKPVLRHPDRQIKMQAIMEKVLLELDQKLPSWPSAYVPTDADRLEMYPLRGMRIFGQYISITLLLFDVLWLAATLLFLLMAVIGFVSLRSILYGTIFSLLFLVFLYVLAWVNSGLLHGAKFRPSN